MRVLYISGTNDYAALSFEREFKGRKINDIIDEYFDENCYNLKTGGDDEFIHGVESRLKNSKSQKTRPPISLETRLKLSRSGKNRKHSKQTKKKMSEWQIGKTVLESTKNKIKETKKLCKSKYNTTIQRLEKNNGIWQTEETKQKIREKYSRQRICIIEGLKFNYMKDVCTYYNISMWTLRNRIKSDHKNWIDWNYA